MLKLLRRLLLAAWFYWKIHRKVLLDIISSNQTGFIKDRFSFFNVRRLFNVIYYPSESPVPEVVVSLDAEKAFNRVKWCYLFHTLETFGFGLWSSYYTHLQSTQYAIIILLLDIVR